LSTFENIKAIDQRYTNLAEQSCCLSCGSALSHGKVQTGEFCVDLGSGRGNDVLRMAQDVGESGFVWGIDISEGMLAKARKTAERLGVENADFLYSDLTSLPIATNSINLVISNCVLNHAQDKLSVWKEIFRILKPGGRFAISDIYSTVKVPDHYKNDPEAVAECWAGADTKDQYINTVLSAGFSQLAILEESAPYPKGEIEVCSMTLAGLKQPQG
jgi:ubiquinone/menaquinone biosynthesis C-methylase UbiE